MCWWLRSSGSLDRSACCFLYFTLPVQCIFIGADLIEIPAAAHCCKSLNTTLIVHGMIVNVGARRLAHDTFTYGTPGEGIYRQNTGRAGSVWEGWGCRWRYGVIMPTKDEDCKSKITFVSVSHRVAAPLTTCIVGEVMEAEDWSTPDEFLPRGADEPPDLKWDVCVIKLADPVTWFPAAPFSKAATWIQNITYKQTPLHAMTR